MAEKPKEIHCESWLELLIDMGGSLMGAAGRIQSKEFKAKLHLKEADRKAALEQVRAESKEIMQNALKKYLNRHNISIFLNEANIAAGKKMLIQAIANLKEDYYIYAEPVNDKTNILFEIYRRTKERPVIEFSGTLSDLTADTIFNIIAKFTNTNGQQP